jgi:hypothetical protein
MFHNLETISMCAYISISNRLRKNLVSTYGILTLYLPHNLMCCGSKAIYEFGMLVSQLYLDCLYHNYITLINTYQIIPLTMKMSNALSFSLNLMQATAVLPISS